jgi:hypothetical protein
MAAGFGANFALPAGDYVAQIVDVTTVEFDSRKNPGKKDVKWKWIIDVKARGSQEWQRSDILTGQRFLPKEQIKSPQFIPALHHLSKALGVPVPTTAAQAMAWDEQDQIGKQFRMRITLNEDTEQLETQYLPMPSAQATAVAESAAAPPPPPVSAPAAVAGDDDLWKE